MCSLLRQVLQSHALVQVCQQTFATARKRTVPPIQTAMGSFRPHNALPTLLFPLFAFYSLHMRKHVLADGRLRFWISFAHTLHHPIQFCRLLSEVNAAVAHVHPAPPKPNIKALMIRCIKELETPRLYRWGDVGMHHSSPERHIVEQAPKRCCDA